MTSPSVSRYWSPAVTEERIYSKPPPVGALIGHMGKAYRVTAIDDIPPDLIEPDEDRPYRVRVLPVGSDREHGMRVHRRRGQSWHVLPEHYAICAACGDLAPCVGHESAVAARRAAERAERDMQVLPGCCPACNEVITKRQVTINFPGPNLLNPLAEPDVRFHTRHKCIGAARRYEEQWVAVDPIIRPRSLLTLSCEGTVLVHQEDGSAECVGAQDCPSVHARHRGVTACTFQSHGCGRGCTGVQFGTRYVSPPRPKGLRLNEETTLR